LPERFRPWSDLPSGLWGDSGAAASQAKRGRAHRTSLIVPPLAGAPLASSGLRTCEIPNAIVAHPATSGKKCGKEGERSPQLCSGGQTPPLEHKRCPVHALTVAIGSPRGPGVFIDEILLTEYIEPVKQFIYKKVSVIVSSWIWYRAEAQLDANESSFRAGSAAMPLAVREACGFPATERLLGEVRQG
jgi:hypothetical protein